MFILKSKSISNRKLLSITFQPPHLDQHVVDVDPFHQHPGERSQEEVVKESGDGGADGPVVGGVEPEHEQDLGAEETDRQVPVNRCSVAAKCCRNEDLDQVGSILWFLSKLVHSN